MMDKLLERLPHSSVLIVFVGYPFPPTHQRLRLKPIRARRDWFDNAGRQYRRGCVCSQGRLSGQAIIIGDTQSCAVVSSAINMVKVSSQPPARIVSINLPETVVLKVSREHFLAIAAANKDIRLERTAEGELVVNPPTGWETGAYNWSIAGELYLWWRSSRERGQAFDSSTGFDLPNGATRSPDASWISQARWDALTPAQKGTFANICPDFVVELRSSSDRLQPLQDKMAEYLENGTQLGWLIDPQQRRVEIYRSGLPVEVLENPAELSGEDVLVGFRLALSRVW